MTKTNKEETAQILINAPIVQSRKQELPVDDTRATFIIKKDLWKKLKDYQNTSKYRTMKELMDDMIESFLKEK